MGGYKGITVLASEGVILKRADGGCRFARHLDFGQAENFSMWVGFTSKQFHLRRYAAEKLGQRDLQRAS